MKQTDQLRRRQQVANKPPQIFQPPYKRAEIKEDIQRQMEFAFEDMYTEERSMNYPCFDSTKHKRAFSDKISVISWHFSFINYIYVFSKLQLFVVLGIKGDLVVPLVPEPLPDLPTGSEDHELDVTLDEVAPPLSENTEPDGGKGAGTSQQESPTQGERPVMSTLYEK